MYVRVFTKQHKAVLKEIRQFGRYTAKEENIERDLGSMRKYVIEAYQILSQYGPNIQNKPDDVKYPIWVSLSRENTMLLTPDEVILELEVEKDSITMINMEKWASILNFLYIPQDEEDRRKHEEELKTYDVSDTTAYMSNFYPHIKKKIRESWKRLYDDSITLYGTNCYGNIWEIREEWIKNITEGK